MVTAILIPLICIYFYWLTKKEWTLKKKEWENAGTIPEHSRLIGEIQTITIESEKFYMGLYLIVFILEVKHNGKTTKAMKKLPVGSEQHHFEEFLYQKVALYGKWDGPIFLLNRIVLLS
ncbi:MAG: hypothetical protein K0R71_27 [Bacillales bacterium]|jgi:hypothetical protein|nr:hypothetical protein [Bacillales bacterium]